MKIEKLSENTLRCTLTADDLASMRVDLHELAYGSEKAKHLFQDLMSRAFAEFGFTTDGCPLVVEAVPMQTGSIILLVTKVSDPEELDSRFARFTDTSGAEDEDNDFPPEDADIIIPPQEDGEFESIDLLSDDHLFYSDEEEYVCDAGAPKKFPADDGPDFTEDDMDKFNRRFSEFLGKNCQMSDEDTGKEEKLQSEQDPPSGEASSEGALNLDIQVLEFKALSAIEAYCRTLKGDPSCSSSLYKDPDKGLYYLILQAKPGCQRKFNIAVAMAGEFGRRCSNYYFNIFHYDEFCQLLIKDKAIEVMRDL